MHKRALASPPRVLLTAPLLGGCGLLGGPDLVIYNAQHEELMTEIVPLFEEETGLDVELRNGKDLELANQLVAEGTDSPADVFLTENSPAMSIVDNAGLFAPVSEAATAPIPDAYVPSSGNWTGILARSTVAMYNTEALTEADLPASILDFAEPEWDGRVGFSPTGADFQAIVSAVLEAEGEEATAEWLAGLKENGTVLDNNLVVMQSVNEGDVDAGIAYHYYWYRDQQESGENSDSTALHFFGDQDPGAFVSISGAGVLASSEHQDNAQQFVEFLTSTEGQQAMADSYALEYPLNPEATLDLRGQAVRRARAPGDRPGHAQRPAGHRADDRGGPALTIFTTPGLATGPAPRGRRGGPSRPAPWPLLAGGGAVALLALVPLGFVATYTVIIGPSEAWDADRAAAGRGCCCGTRCGSRSAAWCCRRVLGVGLAFVVERTDVRRKGLWHGLLVAPLAVPGVRQQLCVGVARPVVVGYGGALLVITLSLLPAGLPAGRSPRCAGSTRRWRSRRGRWATAAGGRSGRWCCPSCARRCSAATLLVGLHLLAEFGALQLLRFPTFTTAIYDLYGSTFNGAAANMIAGVLVLCCLLLLLGELRLRGRRRFARIGHGAARDRGAGAARRGPVPARGGPGRAGRAVRRRPDLRPGALAAGRLVDGVPARRARGRGRLHARPRRGRRGRDDALRAAGRLAGGPPPRRGDDG